MVPYLPKLQDNLYEDKHPVSIDKSKTMGKDNDLPYPEHIKKARVLEYDIIEIIPEA